MLSKSKKNVLNKVNHEVNNTSDNKKKIKFDFNPIKIKVKKYNLRFPIDGMF